MSTIIGRPYKTFLYMELKFIVKLVSHLNCVNEIVSVGIIFSTTCLVTPPSTLLQDKASTQINAKNVVTVLNIMLKIWTYLIVLSSQNVSMYLWL